MSQTCFTHIIVIIIIIITVTRSTDSIVYFSSAVFLILSLVDELTLNSAVFFILSRTYIELAIVHDESLKA